MRPRPELIIGGGGGHRQQIDALDDEQSALLAKHAILLHSIEADGHPLSRRTDEVRDLVPLSRAGVIFELGNALASRDLKRALALVRRLLDQGESAIGLLLVAVLPTVRSLLLAKDLMERHGLSRPSVPYTFISALNRLPAGATEHLPRKKDGSVNAYALGIAAQHAHRFKTEQLVAGLEACLEANLQLVSTQLDHELILTELIVKILGSNNAAAA